MKRIYLASPHMSDEGFELEYVHETFASNWIAPLGENVNEFEKEIAARMGMKYGAALSAGTAAIHLALKYLGVGDGDIVFCQSLTFSASANPILYQNAVPVFIDSSIITWNMCPDALEQAFEKYDKLGKLPKAVIVVHLYGMAADMDRIMQICDRYQVPVVEDAAESLGTTYKGKPTGSFGKFGICSFNGNKIITTSGGGMLVSNDDDAVKKVRFWATQSRDQARHYQHTEIGYNYRMSNVLAGIGRGQLKVLDKRIEQKTYIFNYYKKHLGELPGVEFMPENEWNVPNFWLSCMMLNPLETDVKPLDIMIALEKENIEARPIWKPMHLQPVFEKYDYVGGEVCEMIFERGLCLPSDTKMGDAELERVVGVCFAKVNE